ncbi:MAG: hypothetical protein ACRC62_28820 [Microcoleus sp.]
MVIGNYQLSTINYQLRGRARGHRPYQLFGRARGHRPYLSTINYQLLTNYA